ncbi:MAG: hypothetical protein AW07_01223 [Candidatus Accumulibacter sp. SK-11]|nr:MAG: hypothetical protein AW07_01223 [Candidatus Accumulibacter sp. SK-11]
MRHVDHAHDAVGDRQPERRQQQDRTERQAGEGAAEVVRPGQPLLDRADRGAGGGAHGAVGFDPGIALLLGQRQQELANARIAALAQRLDGREANGGVGRPKTGLRMRELQPRPNLRILFRGERAVEQRQHLRVDVLIDFLRRLPANLALGREEAQRRQRRRQFAPHAVVDADRFDAGRRRRQLAVAGGVEDPSTRAQDDDALAGDRQRIPGHRLQHWLRLFRRCLDQRQDGGNAGIRIVSGERPEQPRVDRRLRARDAQQTDTQQ